MTCCGGKKATTAAGDTQEQGKVDVPARERFPLDWVDSFICEIRPHVFLRETDGMLILLPNQSYRLNTQGMKLLGALLRGKTLSQILAGRELPDKVREDIFFFLTGIAEMMKGCLGEGRNRPGVETIEYKRPYHSLPILSEVALTYRCNLSCRFCYAGSKWGNSTSEMKTDEVIGILGMIRRQAEVPSVSFTGGEPTLRDDLPRLISEAASLGLRVNLITNGTLVTTAMAEEFRKAGLASAQVSLEGPDAETHESLTGTPGSFDSTLAGIDSIRRAGISVHCNSTINGANVGRMTAMPALARKLGLERLSMNMVIPSPWLKDHAPDMIVKYSKIGPIVLEIKERARAEGLKFLWYSPTPYCLFNPIAHNLGNKGCAACDGLLSIDPAGKVIPCSSFFEAQGSLVTSTFSDVWNSPGAAAIRGKSRAPEACRACDRFELCEGACPLYWETIGTGELEGTSPTRGRMCPNSQDEPQDAAVSGQGHGWPVLGPTDAVLEGTSPTRGRMCPNSQDGAVLEGTRPKKEAQCP